MYPFSNVNLGLFAKFYLIYFFYIFINEKSKMYDSENFWLYICSKKKTDFLKSTILFFSSINERFSQHIFSCFRIDFVHNIFTPMLFSLWVSFYSNITDFFQLKSNEENKNGRAKHSIPGKIHFTHSGILKHFFTISQHLSVKSR